MAPVVLLWLDLLSAAAVLGIAGCFWLAYWRLRGALPLLLGVGFALLAVGILTASTSQFDLQPADPLVDLVRLGAHTSAALVFLFAYLDARAERSRPWLAFGWASATTGLLLVLLAPLLFADVRLDARREWLAAHAVQAFCYGACFLLSGTKLLQRPSWRATLVPLGFLAYAIGKYVWTLIDLTGDQGLVPHVYAWRFLTIGLFLGALVPALRLGGTPRAAA